MAARIERFRIFLSQRKVETDFSYSRHALSVLEKLQKQLHYALNSPFRLGKVEELPFEVPVPLELPQEPQKYSFLDAAVAQSIGGRRLQEDRFLLKHEVVFEWKDSLQRGHLFGVFDGHGDRGKAGEYITQQLPIYFAKLLTGLSHKADIVNEEVVTNAFVHLFPSLSQGYASSRDSLGGAVVTCVFIYENKIYCANVGDSRTILVKKEKTHALSEVGTAMDPRFRRWHEKIGNSIVYRPPDYFVAKPNFGFGDRMYTPARAVGSSSWMCSRPKITRIFIDPKPQEAKDPETIYAEPGDFLVLASDGLFEPAEEGEVAQAVRSLARANASLEQMTIQIANHAGSYKGNDNVTVMVVAL